MNVNQKKFDVMTADFRRIGQIEAATPEAALAKAKTEMRVHNPVVGPATEEQPKQRTYPPRAGFRHGRRFGA